MKTQALLFERLEGDVARCGVCQRRCTIPPGDVGWCRTRRNEDGTLYSLIYGEVSSVSVNPIEKKPVFHFHPGSRWLSLGSVGCNFRCPGCQNWELSHWQDGETGTEYLPPERAVLLAKEYGCIGISWTFNEPSIWFEYTLDGAKAAKRDGLHTNYVTNGTISRDALAALAPYLDVFRVDLKGFSDSTYKRIGHVGGFEQILDVIRLAKGFGMHVEVVTNIIPGINDSASELSNLARWINDTLGAEMPWHVTRFYPHLKLHSVPPTPISTLERARTLGKEAGLWYVYVGNVPGHRWEHTYCHVCGHLLIERYVFDVIDNEIDDGMCPECGVGVPGVWGCGR
jgi:pyruvate formate lyase activating enzyme